MSATALYGPKAHERTGAGTIVVTLSLARAGRWRLVLENAASSAGNLTGVSWRKSAIGTHYGPAAAQTVASAVTPGNAWGASDSDDCVDQLEVTLTVSDTASVTVSLAGV